MMQLEGSREMPPAGLREEETGPERRSYLPGVTQPTGDRGRVRSALVSCLPGRRRRENPERGGEGLLGRLEVKGDYLGGGRMAPTHGKVLEHWPPALCVRTGPVR